MRTWPRPQVATLAFLLPIISAMATEELPPLSGKELLDFLGPVSPNAIHWTKQSMIDFQIYNGEAMSPLVGHVSFYVGSGPSPKHSPSSTVVRGWLGIWPVKWHRWSEDNQVSQQALIYMRWYQEVDIYFSAPQQADVDKLVAIVSQLQFFNKKPDPPPWGDSVADELLDTHPSLYWGVISFAPALFLFGIYLLNRGLRGPARKLSGRLGWLTVYSLGFFVIMGAVFWLSAPAPFIKTVMLSHATSLTVIYGGTLALLFCLVLPIIVVITRCRRL